MAGPLKLSLKSFNQEDPITLEATLTQGGPLWFLSFRLDDADALRELYWPPLSENSRVIGLWESTCLEAFFLYEDGSYEEWNFSPSGSWNCFSFSKYRTPQNLVEKQVTGPQIKNKEKGSLNVALDSHTIKEATKVNLTAVIELGGKLHFLAHQHPLEKPDFHREDTFYSLASPPFSLT